MKALLHPESDVTFLNHWTPSLQLLIGLLHNASETNELLIMKNSHSKGTLARNIVCDVFKYSYLNHEIIAQN